MKKVANQHFLCPFCTFSLWTTPAQIVAHVRKSHPGSRFRKWKRAWDKAQKSGMPRMRFPEFDEVREVRR